MTMQEPGAQSREFFGPFGTAERLIVPPHHRSAATTTCIWVINSTRFSPAWTQWVLSAITLAPVPGVKPATISHQGMTHEMLLLALDPRRGRFDQQALDRVGDGGFYFLTPPNYVDQFEASDAEMLALVAWMAWGMVHGHLQVEPNGRADRQSWLASAVKTLAHIRGEEHAP
jgi:hypothetical protein